jgi:acetylornithine deacetylase/succinyl-diaminopimelate desuccinylase-like protein
MSAKGFQIPKTATRLLQDLIAIPSVNPDGDPGCSSTGEQQIAEYVAAFLKKCGAEVSLLPVLPGRPNVVGQFPSKPRTSTLPLVFAPHLDTVSVRGMMIDPFDPIIVSGKILGRGASDTKGPMASMLWALKTWSEKSKPSGRQIPIVFTGLMGEEAANEGAFHLLQSGFQCQFAIIGEPTDLKIVHAHKGALWFTVETQGKSCHASTPERGKNAIVLMSEVIRRLETDFTAFLHSHSHPHLGKPSFNIGTITGGSKINIVPSHCRIECDIRTVPSCGIQAIEKKLKSLFKDLDGVSIKPQRNPAALDTDPSNPWVQRLKPFTQGITTAPWFCDAAVFSLHKIPAIAIGPGSIQQAHTVDEFIREKDFLRGVTLFEKFLMSLDS